MNKTKKCIRCYITKSLTDFHAKSSMCKTCRREYDMERDKTPKRKEQKQMAQTRYLQKVKEGARPHRVIATRIRTSNNKIIKAIQQGRADTIKEETCLKRFSCSKKVFIQRFEKYFEKNPGMTWQNYGAWHMDHIKPLGSFTLDTEANQKLANHYSNLRPIWATANMKKAYNYEVEQTV